MGDFDGTEFAAGEVRGTRAFKVDLEGRLRGVIYETIWRPGENVAKCLRGVPPEWVARNGEVRVPGHGSGSGSAAFLTTPNSGAAVAAAGGAARGIALFGAAVAAAGGAAQWVASTNNGRCPCGCNQIAASFYEEQPLACGGMEPECTCGFYVYQRGSNDYYSPDNSGHGRQNGPIGGVVRGYGKVVLCTRGFRAEKAEIVALYVDPEAIQRDHALTNSLIRHRVERNYGVPVFGDYAEMLREFPVDDPESGEDFWEAS